MIFSEFSYYRPIILLILIVLSSSEKLYSMFKILPNSSNTSFHVWISVYNDLISLDHYITQSKPKNCKDGGKELKNLINFYACPLWWHLFRISLHYMQLARFSHCDTPSFYPFFTKRKTNAKFYSFDKTCT